MSHSALRSWASLRVFRARSVPQGSSHLLCGRSRDPVDHFFGRLLAEAQLQQYIPSVADMAPACFGALDGWVCSWKRKLSGIYLINIYGMGQHRVQGLSIKGTPVTLVCSYIPMHLPGQCSSHTCVYAVCDSVCCHGRIRSHLIPSGKLLKRCVRPYHPCALLASVDTGVISGSVPSRDTKRAAEGEVREKPGAVDHH